MFKISVCIPVFNSENTVLHTIDSVINQTFKDVEIVIVDNCSTDNTYNLLLNLSKQYDCIKLYRNNENIGMFQNWIKAVDLASCEYIHFLCADDLMLPDCLEKKYKIFDADKNKDITMIFNDSYVINDNDQILLTRRFQKNSMIFDGVPLAKESFRKRNFLGEPSNVLFRKEAFYSIGGINTLLKYAADWDMWLKVASLGKVAYINEPLVKYRISSTNGTSALKIKHFFEDDKIFINSITNFDRINLSKYDLFIHKINFTIRLFMRIVYMKFFC